MKIDMMSVISNNLGKLECKYEKSEVDFLSIMDNKIEIENIFKSIDKDHGSTKNELNELIALLLIRLSIDEAVVDNTELKSLQNYIDVKDKFINKEKEEFNKESINIKIENSSELWVKLQEFIENECKSEQIIGLIDKKLSSEDKEIVKEALVKWDEALNFKDIEKENIFKGVNNHKIKSIETLIDKVRLTESDEFKCKEESFEINGLRNKNMLNEKMDMLSNEMQTLNNIAFSSKTLDIKIEDIQPQMIRKAFIVEDVFQAVKYLNNNKIEELTVKLNPKDLGELNINIVKMAEENEIIITISKKESFVLINEKINEIENHLNNLDINVKQISIKVKAENQNDFSGNFNQQFNENKNKRESKGGILTDKISVEEDSLLNEDTNLNLLI